MDYFDSKVICARLDAPYQKMMEELKFPGETNGQFVRRAIDALALTDEKFAVILGEEDHGV